MKALITGSRGFVGQYLAAELSANGYIVSGIDLTEDENTKSVDLLDIRAVRDYVNAIQPDVLFHLAAQAAIPLSWKDPQKTFELNVIGTINLLETVRMEKRACRVVIVGSADQYGAISSAEAISEDMALRPQNPYAASKKAQEDMALIYAKFYSMDICLTRSFNHSGPGQKPGFLIPDLCHGITQVEQGKTSCMKIGNTEAIRDFTDVRDIVKAYRLICEKGIKGEIYNVGSGKGRKVRDVLDALVGMAYCEIPVQPDIDRMRVSDTPVLVCDNTKLKRHTGWEPLLSFEQALKDSLEYYRNQGVSL
jgi:GDP-4-dehydro-6-deoxy-D-mannose reductase